MDKLLMVKTAGRGSGVFPISSLDDPDCWQPTTKEIEINKITEPSSLHTLHPY
jgi:hypothetical protein